MILLQVIVCLVGSAVSFSEFDTFVHNGEMSLVENSFWRRVGIVPSGYSPAKNNIEEISGLSDFFDVNHKEFKSFKEYVNNGYTKKGLTFNIYDDNHRRAAIALFKLLLKLDDKRLEKVSLWAEENINNDLYDYVWRLAMLHGVNLKPILPPFITKPNYFVNSETIYKAAKLKNNNGRFHRDDATENQYYRTDDTIFINTNYSGWNAMENGCTELNYFREDIGLNSYAYGLSLLSPFWMPNTDFEFENPRMIEFIYYKYHYLYTRYFLEFKHSGNPDIVSCFNQYNPNLVYDNGLPFPVRPPFKFLWSEGKALILTLDITLKELLQRGFIIREGGSQRVNITEDNHLDLIVKLIRANIAGIQASKVVMALLGYNAQENITDVYNPAPSVVHHAMTQMRDPEFLDRIILNILNYVIEYKYKMAPFDLETYETDEVKIIDANIPDLTTYFSYYSFDIGRAINDYKDVVQSPLVLAARQRRLNHLPFHFNFTIQSVKDNDVAVRLFLGPQCTGTECWSDFPKFFELDAFNIQLKKGKNNLTWSPKSSNRYSNDDYYNLENKSMNDKYSIYHFPESLLIPRGLENGLNLTVFVIITPVNNNTTDVDEILAKGFYQKICSKIDDKPLGFPFHKRAIGFNASASNYKLLNIKIFHQKSYVDRSGYFSKDLY